ncbi:MAG: M50 family metallopeptidase, partial [Caulobacteraceae bacterium]
MSGFISTALLTVIPFLLVLTLVVTIHELGHFWAARALGIEIDRFAIGFGRPILAWTDKHGVEWRIGWIPLGGYVRFAGDQEASSTVPDAEDLAELRDQIRREQGVGAERRYFHFKPVWARAIVAAAGPVANFILAIFLFTLLLTTIGEVLVSPKVEGVTPGSAAERAGFKKGDIVRSVDGRVIRDFMDMKQYVALRSGQPIRFVVERGGADVALVATPQRTAQVDHLTGSTSRLGVLGLSSSTAPGGVAMKRYPPLEAVGVSVQRTWSIIDTTVFYLSRLAR